MGLDITAYKNVEWLKYYGNIDEFDMWDDDEDIRYAYEYPDDFFPEHLGSVKRGYSFRYGDVHRFRAGSYSGYNAWRDWLCKLALEVEANDVWDNHGAYEDRPFYWLINFSDCEGIIGPEKSAILAQNFRDFEDQIPEETEEWLIDRYLNWKLAFEFAADNGFVEFH